MRLLLVLVTFVACQRSTPAAAPAPPAPSSAEALAAPAPEIRPSGVPEAPTEPDRLALVVTVEDLTLSAERPVALGEETLRALVAEAAEAAGFVLIGATPSAAPPDTAAKKPSKATVELHYALTTDGKVDPRAERGLLTWGVMTGVRVVGPDGLAEVLEGASIGEAPFVREALPDLGAAFREVLQTGARSAFLDVAMQLRYASAPVSDVLSGLRAMQREERWAATRRAAALGDAQLTKRLVANLEGAEGLEIGLIAVALARLGVAPPVEQLAERIDGLPESVALLVVDALAGLGTPGAKAALARIAKSHAEARVRAAARGE